MFGMSLEKELSKSDPKYRNRFELLYDNKETKKCFDEFVLGDGYEL
jgi:hypothetical protein